MSVSRLLFSSACLEDSDFCGSVMSLSEAFEGSCIDRRILFVFCDAESKHKDDDRKDNSLAGRSGGKVSFFYFLGTVYKRDMRAVAACEESGYGVQEAHRWQVLRV